MNKIYSVLQDIYDNEDKILRQLTDEQLETVIYLINRAYDRGCAKGASIK